MSNQMAVQVAGVASSSYEVMQSVVKVLAAVKKALSDGWQPMQDIPAVIAEAIRDLAPAVSKLGDLSTELSADKEAVAKALLVSALDAMDLFK